ncbi:MAG: SufE family protein [Rubricoccaceae bacterium]
MPPRLADIAEQFQMVAPEDRLYLLLDYADALPDLPERLAPLRDAGAGRVHECATPVFLYPELEQGRLRLHADVPRESPTVRGLVGLLADALGGEPAAAVADVPDDLLRRLGIAEQLGMRRQQGFAGVLFHLKRRVAEAAEGPSAA